MTTVPLIPENAPFSAEQRAWLNGYLAGLFSRGPAVDISNLRSQISNSAAVLKPLTILFGSQTGTSETLAKRAAKDAGKRGFAASIMDMAAFTPAQLAQEQNVLVITSTYGDGEPPDNAKALHAALAAACSQLAAPLPGDGQDKHRADSSQQRCGSPLSSLRFSVCGLGDTNYVQFNKCAKDFDERLEKLGATRVSPRVDCDLDYEAKFAAWLDAALGALAQSDKGQVTSDKTKALAATDSPLVTDHSSLITGTAYSRSHPFPASVLAIRNLNAAGSAKEVNHVEFSLEGSGLTYETGDALGVVPQNCPELVTALLAALGCDGEEAVPVPDGSTDSLRHALTAHYDLARPSGEFIARYGAPAADAGGGTATATATAPAHVIDIVLTRPETRLAPADFVRLLRKLQPRLYSIASSPRAHPGQVHLTVGAVRYEAHGRARKGVCSTFLVERALAAGKVGVFVHSNRSFRPPASGATPMIMVGPGTGIAPFRAFLAERQAAGAPGKNWLFFGDQKAASDFLYRDELTALLRAGTLTRLDTAFSRDQAEKIYVQQRMLENATELFAWLEAGAHFYVCGDASRMAKDVDAALHRVVETAGGRSPDAAAAYVQALKAAKRYARDVY